MQGHEILWQRHTGLVVTRLPFHEEKLGNVRARTFSGDTQLDELVWHRDDEDRVVRVIESDGWYFQMDDELPVEMRPGDVFSVPRRQWHRVIKRGSSRLVVEIRVNDPVAST